MRYLTQHSPHKSPSFKFKSTFTSEALGVPPVTNTLCDTVKECVCTTWERGTKSSKQNPVNTRYSQPPSWGSKERVSLKLHQELGLCASTSLGGTQALLTERSPHQAPRLRHDLHLRFKLQSETGAIKERHPFLFCWRLQSYWKGMCWCGDSFILTHFIFSPQNILCGSTDCILMIQTSIFILRYSPCISSEFLYYYNYYF